jgi:hypothetical protein
MDDFTILDWFLHQPKTRRERIIKAARAMRSAGAGDITSNVKYIAGQQAPIYIEIQNARVSHRAYNPTT